MNQQCISVNLEGDFIDSFIYSGTLFLVHADSKITTYSWEALLGTALQNQSQNNWTASTYDFLKDCRNGAQLSDRTSKFIQIDKHELEKELVSTLSLDGWPTDINIFTNRFYIASQNGVEELPYDYKTRRLDSDNRLHIWKKYAYKVSPNNEHQLAIAAGQNGVIAVSPRSGYINEKEDIKTLLEINSHDCEWIGRSLVANSLEGAYLSIFPEFPKRPNGQIPLKYWEEVNKIKKQQPEIRNVTNDGNNSVVYAWIGGGKLFTLLENGELSVVQINKTEDSEQKSSVADDLDVEIGMGARFSRAGKVLAARSGLFGTVIEIGDELCCVTENGTESVSIRPVSWRVFPRARSYLNHLHVIENDQLSIRAYFTSATPNISDRFGIKIRDVL